MGRCAQPGENCRHYFSLPRATDRKKGEVLSLIEQELWKIPFIMIVCTQLFTHIIMLKGIKNTGLVTCARLGGDRFQ